MNRRRATRTRLFVVALLVAAAILAWLVLRDTGEGDPRPAPVEAGQGDSRQ